MLNTKFSFGLADTAKRETTCQSLNCCLSAPNSPFISALWKINPGLLTVLLCQQRVLERHSREKTVRPVSLGLTGWDPAGPGFLCAGESSCTCCPKARLFQQLTPKAQAVSRGPRRAVQGTSPALIWDGFLAQCFQLVTSLWTVSLGAPGGRIPASSASTVL